MPINESTGRPRSNLTREQQRQAEAAIYGINMANETHEITPDEIERMRAIVAQHDRVAGINEFDLNKPPQQPYKYEAYPKMVYTVVKDRQEFEKKLSEGWKEAPATAAEPLQKDVSAPKMMYAVVADKEQLDKKSKEGGKEIPPGLPAANPGPGSHYSGLDPATAAEAEAADRKLHEKPKGK